MDEIMKLFGSPENILKMIKQYATKAGRATTRIMLQLYFVLKSPATPKLDKTIIIAALAYQLLPNQLLSVSRNGLLGLLDNVVTLGVAYNRVKARVTPEINYEVDTMLDNWFGPEWSDIDPDPNITDDHTLYDPLP